MIDFPPYGLMPRAYPVEIGVPADWKPGESYDSWSARTLTMIYEVLWPKWNFGKLEWEGESKGNMESLTRADLDILLKFRTNGLSRPIDQRVASPLRKPGGMTHGQFFTAEDDSKIGESYSEYELKEVVPPAAVRTMFTSDPTKHGRKLGNTPIYFKHFLQRPRAYQAAVLCKETNFNWSWAKTSMTPAIPSGHCLQGLVGVACLAEQLIIDKFPMGDDNWLALQQLAVDIGDRRVMAGVHYPSDNIASWLIALDLTTHVFENPDPVRKFMWDAITNRSIVYKEIEFAREHSCDARKAYDPSWDKLHQAPE